ncbi:hypothetical protein BOO91_17555 [Vibrio navarrensis]|nr:hypothetical protein UF06_12435 [Vibrio sp. S234-5]MBE3662740.1 hypothetical protein [Vibrio navarrensis]
MDISYNFPNRLLIEKGHQPLFIVIPKPPLLAVVIVLPENAPVLEDKLLSIKFEERHFLQMCMNFSRWKGSKSIVMVENLRFEKGKSVELEYRMMNPC